MEQIGYQNIGTFAVYSTAVPAATFTSGFVKISDTDSLPIYLWASGSALPANIVNDIAESLYSEGGKGAIFVSPVAYPIETIESFQKYDIKYLTFDDLEKQLTEKAKTADETKREIERQKVELLQRGGYSKAKVYKDLIASVENAGNNDAKKKSLEELVGVLAQDLGFKDIEKDKRTPSSELDVRAKNERTTGIWKELGTPVIFEAKNWDKAVSAEEIRNLVGKVKPAKTRFMIAWNGITGKDELKGARLEIIKAKAEGTLVLVLTKLDFEKISGGVYPETLVEERYYNLLYDKVA